MPSIPRSQALNPRDSSDPAPTINVPLIALVLAFSLLFLVLLSMCCCSSGKATSKNERRRRQATDREWVGFTPLSSPSIGHLPAKAKAKASALFSEEVPPAYSENNLLYGSSPQLDQNDTEHLLPPTPSVPAPLSPPPPTYNSSRQDHRDWKE